LLPYLGSEGNVIGADYAADMFPLFGFFSPERLEAKKTWVETWTAEAQSWKTQGSADVSAFQLGSMPETMANSADAVVFIRALHNVSRFENEGGYLTKALSDAFSVLKPGGIVGVVQHKAPETMSDEWASGANGYLKQTFVIAKMQEAGFEFVASSDINNNPKDQPGAQDIVWRLPPSLVTSNEDPKLKEEMQAIGESNRMTLTFKKPKN
jgi:predicted methyltransferase